ncbi:MAG: hypothetical protein SOW41_03195 [Anaerococcus sp.]|jgi:hypothetical protein|nr:hypothetical protein [Peptoniphilaceae bacterium]MDY3055050.1 hypothetical protein [Anaerococcus sp.]
MIENINELEELRRNAYVDAIYAKMDQDNIVGVFSDDSDLLLFSYGFFPMPIVGVDPYIFEYSEDNDLCDPLNSTITYLKTQKCPLIFSSRFFVVDNYCPKFKEELRENTSRDLVDASKLENYLKENFKERFDSERSILVSKKLKEIDSLLEKLELTDISGSLLFKLRFYTRFIKDLDDRISLLENILKDHKFLGKKRKPIRVACPFAVADQIGKKEDGYIKIEKSDQPFYSYENCIYQGQKFITYKEILNG